jgi:MoaA/NifB/PqqE/SkfB family radical SAM enzyme
MRERLVAGDDDAVCRPHCSERSRRAGQPLARERVQVEGTSPAFLANRLQQARELLEGAVTLASRPTAFSFGPTGRCNHHCAMCHNLFDRDHGLVFELPEAFYAEVRELLPTLAELHVSGAGEPLVSAPFREFLSGLDAATYPDLRVHLTTNGALLDARLQERLLHVPFGTILVSLNAVTPETHRVVSGVDDFERVRRNLYTLLANRARFVAGPPAVQLSFVVMRKNVHELPAFLELARDLGCSVRLTAMEPDNLNAAEALTAAPTELAAALALLADLGATWSRDARVVQYLASVASTLASQAETSFVKQVVPPDVSGDRDA